MCFDLGDTSSEILCQYLPPLILLRLSPGRLGGVELMIVWRGGKVQGVRGAQGVWGVRGVWGVQGVRGVWGVRGHWSWCSWRSNKDLTSKRHWGHLVLNSGLLFILFFLNKWLRGFWPRFWPHKQHAGFCSWAPVLQKLSHRPSKQDSKRAIELFWSLELTSPSCFICSDFRTSPSK